MFTLSGESDPDVQYDVPDDLKFVTFDGELTTHFFQVIETSSFVRIL